MSDDVVVKVKLDNSDFKKNINDTKSQMNNFSEAINSSMKKVGKAIAAGFAIEKIVEFGKAIAEAGVNYNALKEQSQTTWTTLLGSQDKAIEQLAKIEEYAAKTPFTQMGVDTMAKYLHNANYEGEAVFETLTKIGDMGSAFGIQEDSLVEMTRQFAQVQQAGYAYTEDLNILADRGVPIYKAIAETVGVTVAEVKKMASEGKITADIYNAAIDSMAETTAGAMDAQSQTFNGIVSTFEDTLTILAGLLTEKLFGALKGVLEVTLPLVEAFVDAYSETGTLSGAFTAIFPVLEEMGVNITALKDVWETFSNALLEVYHTFVVPVIDGFREMFDDMAQKFLENSTNIQQTFSFVGQVLSDVWNTIILPMWELFLEYIFLVWDFFNENITNIMQRWNIVAEAIKLAWEEILKPVFELIMEWVRKLFDKFQEYMPEIQRVVDEVFMMIKTAWETVLKPAFKSIGDFIQNILLPIFDAVFTYGIMPIVDTVFDTIIKLWDNSLKPMFQGIIDFIGGVFTGDWSRVWDGIVGIFGGIWEGLKTVAKAPINAVINMINTMIGGLNNIKLPDWVPGLGGKGINIPKIPELWKGTNFAQGGLTLVGEQGPELVNLNRGASVLPAHKTSQLLENQTDKTEIVLKIENFYNNTDSDIERIADELVYLIKRKKVALGDV